MRSPVLPHGYAEIPPDREDGSSSLVHRALIFTGRLGRIPAVALFPLWGGLIFLIGWLWHPWHIAAAVALAVFLALDWTMLALLPWAKRSWGPVTPSLLGLIGMQTLFFGLCRVISNSAFGLGIAAAASFVLLVIAFYAVWIEPFDVRVTRKTYSVRSWRARTAFRALHISDIHFEGLSPRERELIEIVRAERPDVILLTGDYLNLSSVYDSEAQAGARELMAHFVAPMGTFAVSGSPVVDVAGIVPEIFEGLPIRWLNDEVVPIRHGGQTIWLIGVRNTYRLERDAQVLRSLVAEIPDGELSVLLYHTPDLMPVASEVGVDLYLCGHTHGGQIRVPFFGALATSSRWGKRYEQGQYNEGHTTLYVSRGLGVEGLGAPRARFLAPPEVVLWELQSGVGGQ